MRLSVFIFVFVLLACSTSVKEQPDAARTCSMTFATAVTATLECQAGSGTNVLGIDVEASGAQRFRVKIACDAPNGVKPGKFLTPACTATIDEAGGAMRAWKATSDLAVEITAVPAPGVIGGTASGTFIPGNATTTGVVTMKATF